jgi:hypothetical protein
MDLLGALVVTGFRGGVRVAVDDLDCSLGNLELHLLLVALMGNLLLAFPLAGSHAIMEQLLFLLLIELLHELLDLPALLGALVTGVVHRALRTTLIAARGLARPLVTSWATTPTSCCRVAVTVGALASGLLLLLPPAFFFFLFLFLPLL